MKWKRTCLGTWARGQYAALELDRRGLSDLHDIMSSCQPDSVAWGFGVRRGAIKAFRVLRMKPVYI